MTPKQPSGAQNRKKRANYDKLAKENDELKHLVGKIETISKDKSKLLKTWQQQLMERQGSAYLTNNLPTTPEEIHAILELPVYGTSPEVSVAAINAIRGQQRQGYFYQPAIFCDAILQDSAIYSALMTRVKALTGKTIIFEPADDSDLAKEIQEDVEKNFSKMACPSVLEDMLRWGLLLGVSVAQVMWDSKDGKWMPTLKQMHPKYLWWNYGWYQFAITTADGMSAVLEEDIQWDLFMPYTDHLPWTRGMILPLAMLWLMRNCNEQWWSQHQERNGQGLLVAITSAEATPAEEKVFAQQLFNLGSKPVVRAPQGNEGNKFDVRREDPDSDLYAGYKEILDYATRQVNMVVVGQDKTGMAKTTGMSIGGNDAGELVRLDLMRSDALALGSNLREKLIKSYVKFNYGEEVVELAPYIKWDIEPAEDLVAKTMAWKQFGDALVNLPRSPIGQIIDYRAAADILSLPLLEEGKINLDVPEYMSYLEPEDSPINTKEKDKVE